MLNVEEYIIVPGLLINKNMLINFSSVTLPQSENLKLHILLERNNEGNVIASVLEFPNTQVEAPTTEQALLELKEFLSIRLEKIEIIPIEIQLPQSEAENPWMKFAGVFKDDADFAEIANNLRAERNAVEED
ncbi:MAG: hypothetical protein RMX96_23360 [Nostoc sp. ChiSLP02]|nr:hypothetical protein [Nostoc sp. DedSLP05]MDZ8102427.1 hypothetical protein [Nostoc sp. DedSLP01]MDZ8187775.1 hypothetical protein [Nostoc sp. ChiSLP02]